MTEREAIKELQESLETMQRFGVDGDKSRLVQALIVAIKALSQQTEDAISRYEYGTDGNVYKLTITSGKEYAQQPSVTPKQRTGRWIRITNGRMREIYQCSECGRQIEEDGIEALLHIRYPFCHCGAKMEDQA